MKAYRAEATFSNESEVYGNETWYLTAESEFDADNVTAGLVRNSRYDDDRIPDRMCGWDVEEIELDEIPEGEIVHGLGMPAAVNAPT